MQDEMNDWYSDDMTFCSHISCYVARCERHPSNIRCSEIPHSYSDFRETDYCPIYREEQKRKSNCRCYQLGLEHGDTLYTYNEGDNENILEKIRGIKFCPICGRELKGYDHAG